MAAFSNKSKNAASFSDKPKTSTIDTFLLLEDGFKLLLESGGRILLTEASGFSNRAKGSSSFNNLNKS